MPKQLTDNDKKKRMGTALMFFDHYQQEDDEFLYQIVTGDERGHTWK